MKKIYKYPLTFLLIITIVLLPFLLGIVPIGLSFTNNKIRQVVIAFFNADIDIRGSLRIRLGLNPQLNVTNIFLGSPDSLIPRLVHIEGIQINPALRDLLKGDIHIQTLEVSGVSIDYCPQWLPETNTTQQSVNPPSISVDTLHIQNIDLHCEQTDKQLDFMIGNFDLEGTARAASSMKMKILGTLGKNPFELYATTTGSLDNLLSNPSRFPLTLNLRAFSSEAKLEGSIKNPLSEPGLDATISLTTQNLAESLNAIGLDAPPFTNLEISSQLRADQEEIRLDQAEVTLDQIQATFSGLVRGLSDRPYFDITAQLEQLDFSLMGSTEPDDNDNWAAIRFKPWFDEMQRFDARVQLRIERLINVPLSTEEFYLSAKLDQGELVVDRLDLLLASSPVLGEASLNLNADCPELSTELRISTVNLNILNQFLDNEMDMGGQVEQIVTNTNSCGESLSEFVNTLSVVSNFTNIAPYYQGLELPVMADTLLIKFASQEPGRLEFKGRLEGEELSTEISFAALNTILSGSFWPLTLRAEGTNGNLLLNGDAAMIEGQPILDGQLELEIYQLGVSSPLIGFDPDNPLIMEVDTQISFDQAQLSLTELDASLGQSTFMGNIAWVLDEEDSVIVTNLHSSYLDLEELSKLLPDVGQPEIVSTVETNLPTELDWIAEWLALPSVDFDFVVEKIQSSNFEMDQLTMSGKVSHGLIDSVQVNFRFEEIEIDGYLHADLRQEDWTLDYQFEALNMNIDSLLSKLDITIDGKVTADRLKFDLVSEGQSIQELVENAQLEARIESLLWTREALLGTKTDKLSLSHLEVIADPLNTTHWSGEGDLDGVPINLLMQTPPISEALNKNVSLPFNLLLSSETDAIMADVVISQRTQAYSVIELTISGQKMETINVPLSKLQSPLSEYELHTLITANEGEFHFSGVEARLGKSSATGRLDITLHDESNHFDVTVTSPYIETDDFISLIQELRKINEELTDDAETISLQTQNVEGFLLLAHQKINDLMITNAFDVQFDIEQLWSSGNLLGKARFGLHLDREEFYIDPFDITSPVGTVKAEYLRKRINDGLEAELNVHVEGLEYRGISRMLNPDSDESGLLYLDMSLFSEGAQWEELDDGMHGKINLALFPEGISTDILDLWASNLIFALLPKLPGTGKKKEINCLVARFNTENGVLTSRKLLLDTTDILRR